ncbi:MAG: hypothetical protein D6731_03150 [Planctomycetota bacterium]|nr:MAG: hypothetical protein D6731_03150 [Planctomycetota bacterium]
MSGARVARSRRRAPARGGREADGTALVGVLALTSPLWLLALRQTCGTTLAVGGASPEVFGLAAGLVAWTRPAGRAAAFAALLGLLGDVSNALPYGLDAARLALLAAAVSRLRCALATDLPGASAGVLAAFLLVERASRVLLLAAWLPGLALAPALAHAVLSALYGVALLPVGFALCRTLGER